MSTANALRIILNEKLKNDSLVLPTLPRVAMKVRDIVADPDSNLNDITTILNQDAALSARLIRIANTAHYSRAVRVDKLQAAVTRIGMRQIKNIVMALAMEQLFVSDNELVAQSLAKTWKKSTDVAAYAMALFAIFKSQNKHTHLQIDTLSLTALLHNIGSLPILTEADGYPEVFASPEFLETAVNELQGQIGVSIIKAWNFSEEIITTIEHLDNPEFKTDEVSYLDFVRLAILCQANESKLIACEKQLASFIEKEMIESVSSLFEDKFIEELAASRATFA